MSKIIIVGGTYREYCHSPYWNELYGSGLRAAIIHGKLGNKIEFHTACSKKHEYLLKYLANKNSFKVFVKENATTTSFEYLHSLSIPIQRDISTCDNFIIDGDNNFLVFGLLECSFKIKGNKVVYDPQSPNNPIHFENTNSMAKELVIVCNETEFFKLGQSCDYYECAHNIFKINKSCIAIIIKNGPFGITILTRTFEKKIGINISDPNFTIGSGDVFSSLFAHFWIIECLSIEKSCELASWGVGLYCKSQTLDFSSMNKDVNLVAVSKPIEKSIYLAGPFFTIPQLWFINETKKHLENLGFNVFSPYHDIGLSNNPEVAEKDLEAINNSDLIFALLDEFDPGTLFEIGYGVSKNIPIVVYRNNQDKQNMLMLDGTKCKIYYSYSAAIYNTAWLINE